MGAYEVGRLIFDLRKDEHLAEEFRANRDGVLERYRLTQEEKKAIRNKDVKFIYQLGVNPYLIIGAGGCLGLSRVELILALAGAGPHPTERTTTYPGPSPAVTEELKKMAAGAGPAHPSQMKPSGGRRTT